jgi:hypothetical protein
MAIKVVVTSESTKEKGTFHASGVATNPDGTEKGKAKVLVRQNEGEAPTLVVSKDSKSIILGNEVTEYKSYTFDGDQASVKLAKDVELSFSHLLFAI